MVGFGKELHRQGHKPWKDKYIDYDRLKTLIHEASNTKDAVAAQPELARIYEARQAVFQGVLDQEVRKVIKFYDKKNAELVVRADEALAGGHAALQAVQGEAGPEERRQLVDATVERAQRITEEITALLQFVSLNMKAIRKILKKYSKHLDPITPTPGFLTLEIEHPNDPQWHLLQGTYLPASLAGDLAAMQQHTQLLAAADRLRELYSHPDFQRSGVERSASLTLSSMGDRLLSTLALHMDAMQSAAADAARNAALVHATPWVERAAGMFEPPPPDRYAVATTSGLVLNNLSTLLFMANYTAVLPPTDKLCRHIGISPSWTGAIMGASDAAAIVTSIFISMWTQTSFKHPLLFSAMACLAGNIVFILSFARRSLPLLIASRLLNGLGSARTANRRYTADYVSRAQRTVASAAFVGCSNLGQALGPFLSLPLSLLPYMQVAGLPLNPVTAVGWVMAGLWAAFFVATALAFEEPPKWIPIGLAAPATTIPLPASTNDLTQPLLRLTDCEAPHPSRVGLDPRAPSSSSSALLSPGDEEQPPAVARGGLSEVVPGKKGREWLPTLPGTLACVACLFVQKAMQQAYLDGVPIFTTVLYGWRSVRNSLFLGTISVAMVPVNLLVGALSARVSDRALVMGSVALSVAALAALTGGATSPAAYFAGGVWLFVGTVVLEGTATSLMSKVIWSGFARGVFNAGLLSTEAGTLGRFTGNALLTVTGNATGVRQAGELVAFARRLHTILAVMGVGLLVQLALTYRRLAG